MFSGRLLCGIVGGKAENHIFYALKMGGRYEERYLQHFANPVIHKQDLRHEELLACYPENWAKLVKSIID